VATKPAVRANQIRVVVADDDSLARAAINAILPSDSYKILGEAADGAEALQMVKTLQPDILLLDMNMPNKAGLQTLRELSESSGGMRTIVLTVAIERRQILEALQLGARGIVLKSGAKTVLTKAIDEIMQGRFWINEQPVFDVHAVIKDLAANAPESPASQKMKLLSPKEVQIVRFIVEGRTNKDIANELQTSEQVVKNHLGKIFDKLGVFNRLELALYALDNHLVERH